MSISGNGNSSSVDVSGLVSSHLPENSGGSESTAANLLLQSQEVEAQAEAQPTPIELVSSSSTAVEPPPLVAEGGGSGSNSVRRRPGRPRKRGLEDADVRGSLSAGVTTRLRLPSGNASSSPLLPVNTGTDSTPPDHVSAPPPAEITPTGTLPVPPTYVSESLTPSKKPRGRPRGSVNKQPTQAPTTAPTPRARLNKRHGVITARDLKPHAIFVSPGEDLVGKIIAFAQQGTEDLFIASHYGAVSSATLRQPAATGSTTYEGHYDIISLSGSLLQAEDGDKRIWTGGLTVTLSGRDSQIVAGGVAGPLIAATPSQVVVVGFVLPKEEDPEPGTTIDPAVNTTETGSPAVHGDVNESGGVGGSAGASTSIPDNVGGDVIESLGVGAAGVSIPDNFGGDVNESGGGGGGGASTSIPDNVGGDMNESLGVGAGMSIPDNFGGGDVNESLGGGGGGTAMPDNFWEIEP